MAIRKKIGGGWGGAGGGCVTNSVVDIGSFLEEKLFQFLDLSLPP